MASSPKYLQTGLVTAQVQQREYNLHLYLYQMLEGAADGGNQKVIVDPDLPNYFGMAVVNDWAIYDGILPNGYLVARAQGIHVGAGKTQENWFYSFNMMFVDDSLKGSVLKVEGLNGVNPGAGGQWAIVGGTGEFAHAQGTITYTDTPVNDEYRVGGVMKELRIRAVCPNFAGPILKVLPLIGGINGGHAVDVTTMPQRLESVTIRAGDVIDSISFSYTDEAGNKQTSGRWGGDGGGAPVTINLEPTERVKQIVVTTGNFGPYVVVGSIKIVTNFDSYGPYGKANGTQFVIPEQDNASVVGFHGRAASVLDAIGVYTTAFP